MENPVCKDMAALEVGSDLDLVDCQKRRIDFATIFSSPVIKATESAPTRSTTRV
jgi:hypothetical protein